MRITEEDHARIAAAVAQAELGTSAEIRCVLAWETGNPGLFALVAGALCALVVPPLALLLGFQPHVLAGWLHGWSEGGATPPWLTIGVYAALQAVIASIVTGLGLIPAVRRALTPPPIRRARVRKAAQAQFEALGLTHTQDHTGVLLYASLADHRAEVLADSGIWDKTTPEAWESVVGQLVAGIASGRPADGFVSAAEAAGALLKDRLPPRQDDRNELPDGLAFDR